MSLARILRLLPILWLAVSTAAAQEPKPASPPASAEAHDKDKDEKEPPLPPDAHVPQTIQLDGKPLTYQATVGTIAIYDNLGKKTGLVVYTAYTLEGKDRAVTFAMNGGPGASSVYLNLGAIGPKRIKFGGEGDSPSDPATLNDNPGHLAGFHGSGVHRPHWYGVQPVLGIG